MGSATVIAIPQHKGGVGKTTTTLNLGAALALQGYKVLMIDLDPQADLTAGLGLLDERGTSLHSMLTNKANTPDLNSLILSTDWQSLEILPGTLDMAEFEYAIANRSAREQILRRALRPLLDRFDFIMLDCPPSLGMITINALMAANWALIPVQAEPRSVRAVERVLESINMVRSELEHSDLEIVGLLLTMTAPNNVAREATQVLTERYGDMVLTTSISRRTKAAEDTLYQSSILAYAPKSATAEEYQALASEVLTRIGQEVAHAK